MPPRPGCHLVPTDEEEHEGPEVELTCLPHARVGVQVVGSGGGVGDRAELGRHGGAPLGAAFAHPRTLAATSDGFGQPPAGPYGGHCPGRTYLHHKSPHPPRPDEALGV